jgi:predicted nucleotide-binding protein
MADSTLLPALIEALEKVASDLIGVSVTWFPGGDDLQKDVKELAASYESLQRILAKGAAEDVIPPSGQDATQFLTDLLCSLENSVEASRSAEYFLPDETKAGWTERERFDRKEKTGFWCFGFFDPKLIVDRLLGLDRLAEKVKDVAKRCRNQQLIEEGNRGRAIVREWEKILSDLPAGTNDPGVLDQATVNAGSTPLTAKPDRGETGGTKQGLRSFIVHGHEDSVKLALKNYLQNTLGWPEPVILAEKPSGGKTIIEKFEEHAKNIDVVFVLLTPDDLGGAVGSPSAPRPRQNVILELGHSIGKFGRTSGRVILLYKGDLELPSDLHGIVHIDISNGVEAAGEKIRKEVAMLVRIG